MDAATVSHGTERGHGAALLVAGHTADRRDSSPSTTRNRADRLHAQAAELLLASDLPWHVRRLSPRLAGMHQPGRAAVHRAVLDLAEPPDRVVLVSLVGQIVATGDGPALATEADWRAYGQDGTLPLRHVVAAVARARAAVLLVDLKPDADDTRPDIPSLLAALTPPGVPCLVAVTEPSATLPPPARALVDVLRGQGVDPSQGAVTLAALARRIALRCPHAHLRQEGPGDLVLAYPPAHLDEFFDADLIDSPDSPGGAAGLAATPTAADDLIGQVLPGRFAIQKELARGGFGVVYVARQVAVDRDVAVKVLHRRTVATDPVARLFITEIRAIGRIVHPSIVRIYQADRMADGRLFYAMELVPGDTLRQLLRTEGPLPVTRAVALTRQILAGLQAAHAAHVVHADVKPSNVVLRPATADEPERAVLLDFGVSRLRSGDAGDSRTIGGTPAYMAPEQFRHEPVDARSDLYAVGLMLLEMLTGWRRASGRQVLAPRPLPDTVTDPQVRAALERALADARQDRFASAALFAAALPGGDAAGPAVVQREPFPFLTPLGPDDAAFLAGRQADVHRLLDLVLGHRLVIVTGGSGTGKTSLLRAGLAVRLQALRMGKVLVTCHGPLAQPLAWLLAPGSQPCPPLVEAVQVWQARHRRRLVLVVDQIEALWLDPRRPMAEIAAELRALVDLLATPADVCLVLAVREDQLAGLADLRDLGAPEPALFRLRPLDAEGAREALRLPLQARGISVDPVLLERLVADLALAGRAAGVASDPGSILPAHLQLAGHVLFGALPSDARLLDAATYQRMGGLAAILADHLDRVLDRDLEPRLGPVARAVFVELATAHETRLRRTRPQLVAALADRFAEADVAAVVHVLEARQLVRADPDDGAVALAHDSLVPRVLAWARKRDLARQRAAELVRFHVHRSTDDAASLPPEADLREIEGQPEALSQLEAEWHARYGTGDGNEGRPWSPRRLVAHARRVHTWRKRRRWGAFAALVGVAAVLAGFEARDWYRKALNLGRFELQVEVFAIDDVEATRVVPAAALPDLHVELRRVGPWLGLQAGLPADATLVTIERLDAGGPGPARFAIEAPGGDWALAVRGRHRAGEAACPASLVWRATLPGHAETTTAPSLVRRIRVPDCQATRWNQAAVPAGRFQSGDDDPHGRFPKQEKRLPAFAIDRWEAANADYRRFLAATRDLDATPRIEPVAGARPAHPHYGKARHPVGDVAWTDARDYCLWLGRTLPTLAQAEKAGRGGTCLDGDAACRQPNPLPRRRFPWGDAVPPDPDYLRYVAHRTPNPKGADDAHSTLPVDTLPGGQGPQGVLHLVGNVLEWRADGPQDGASQATAATRWAHGGYWNSAQPEQLWLGYASAITAGNQRVYLGFRCATHP